MAQKLVPLPEVYGSAINGALADDYDAVLRKHSGPPTVEGFPAARMMHIGEVCCWAARVADNRHSSDGWSVYGLAVAPDGLVLEVHPAVSVTNRSRRRGGLADGRCDTIGCGGYLLTDKGVAGYLALDAGPPVGGPQTEAAALSRLAWELRRMSEAEMAGYDPAVAREALVELHKQGHGPLGSVKAPHLAWCALGGVGMLLGPKPRAQPRLAASRAPTVPKKTTKKAAPTI